MTGSANDEWNHYELTMAVYLIEKEILHLRRGKLNASSLDAKTLQHAVNFIEYNMREMEITGGNGD